MKAFLQHFRKIISRAARLCAGFFLADFRGRMSSVPCRCYIWLHLLIGVIAANVLVTEGSTAETYWSISIIWEDMLDRGALFLLPMLPWFAYCLLALLPSYLLRRLRDAGRSGKWLILWYLSLVLFPIWPLVWLYWAHVMKLPSTSKTS